MKKELTASHLKFVSEKEKDVRFGKVQFLKDEENDCYFTVYSRLFHQKESVEDINSKLQLRISEGCRFYVPPAGFSVKEENSICSAYSAISVISPYPEEDFLRELKKRIKQNLSFRAEELECLMDCCLKGLSHLQRLGIEHGKLAPEWIALTTTGYAIIDDPLHDISCAPNLNDTPLYLSPQTYQFACDGKKMEKDYRNDVFSLGLILLEAGLLKRVGESIYKIKPNKPPNVEQIKTLIKEFEYYYQKSPKLCQGVKNMLEMTSKMRLNPTDLIKILEKREILNSRSRANGSSQSPIRTSPYPPNSNRLHTPLPPRIRSPQPSRARIEPWSPLNTAFSAAPEIRRAESNFAANSSPVYRLEDPRNPYYQEYLKLKVIAESTPLSQPLNKENYQNPLLQNVRRATSTDRPNYVLY